MVRREGASSFYKGFTANFMRIGSYSCCFFVALEQIKTLFDDSEETLLPYNKQDQEPIELRSDKPTYQY